MTKNNTSPAGISPTNTDSSNGNSAKPKRRAPFIALALALVAGASGTIYWYLTRNVEFTDDAQIEGHIISVASRIQGQVDKVKVSDHQQVKKGDVLVELDRSELEARLDAANADLLSAEASVEAAEAQLSLVDRNAEASLRQAKGGLSQASSGVSSTKAGLDQAQADIDAADSRYKLTKLEFERAQHLFEQGAISQADMDTRQAAFDQAEAAHSQAAARFVSAKAAVNGGYASVEQAKGRLAAAETGPEQVKAASAALHVANARVKQAQAAKRLAELNLSYATVRSPEGGVIERRNVEVGQMVSPERPLLAVIPLDDIWVVANFKEDQLRDMKPGQPADITIDAYPGHVLKGHVKSIAAGTGARFALLPPDNATGNFVKVVQRVPVWVNIDNRGLLQCRPGMSATVTVRVR
jgi:membrane fusion protein (multidrug efflux system)